MSRSFLSGVIWVGKHLQGARFVGTDLLELMSTVMIEIQRKGKCQTMFAVCSYLALCDS